VGFLEYPACRHILIRMAVTWSNIDHVGKMEYYTYKKAQNNNLNAKWRLLQTRICGGIKMGSLVKRKKFSSLIGKVTEQSFLNLAFCSICKIIVATSLKSSSTSESKKAT
jgi:hypothetical protein